MAFVLHFKNYAGAVSLLNHPDFTESRILFTPVCPSGHSKLFQKLPIKDQDSDDNSNSE